MQWIFYCRPPGWLYSPALMRNSSQKKSHKFRRLPLCSILNFNLMEFSEIETKNFNSGSCFFKLGKLGTISPAANFLNCVHIGKSQTIAAIICGLSYGKRFVKLREVFRLQTQEEAIERCPGKQILKPICASILAVLHLYFICQKKYFILQRLYFYS